MLKQEKSMAKRQLKIWFPILLAAILIFGFHTKSFAADDLDTLIEAAWNAAPSISSLEEKIEAANLMIVQAGVWKDPMIAVEYSNLPVDSFVPGNHAMSGIQFKLQQTFPFPGKTGKREKVAAARVDAVRYELAEKKNQIRGLVTRAYWNLTLARHLKKVTERHILEVENLLTSVKSRYEVGGAGLHDLLRLAVLRDKLIDELNDFDRKDVDLTASINTLLSRPTAVKVETPENIEAEKVWPSQALTYEKALESRSLLKAWTQEAKAQQLAAKRASVEGWPDPTVWAGYRLRDEITNDQGMIVDEGVDFFSVGISFPLPFFNKNRWGAFKQESLANKRSAESKRAALADEIRGELEKAYAAWKRAFQKADTYSKVIFPGQKQTLDATLASYQVGRAGFNSLYAAKVGLLDVERELTKAVFETKIQESIVETLVGDNILVQGVGK